MEIKKETTVGSSGVPTQAQLDAINAQAKGKLKHVLFCGTGALLSPLSTQQGESIPAVCHAVSIGMERR